jgi:hypothetical protein
VEAVIRIAVTGTAVVCLGLLGVAAIRRIAGLGGRSAGSPTDLDRAVGSDGRRGDRTPTPAADGSPMQRVPWSAAVEGAAWGWALFLFMVASPVLMPWYMAWMLPLVWVMPRAGRAVAIAVSCLLCVTHGIAEPELVVHVNAVQLWIGHDIVGPIMLATLVWVAVRAVRMAQGRSALEDAALSGGPPGGERVPARAERH